MGWLNFFWCASTSIRGRMFMSARIRSGWRFKLLLYFISVDVGAATPFILARILCHEWWPLHAVFQLREVEALNQSPRMRNNVVHVWERISVNFGLLKPPPLLGWEAETQIIPYRTVESSNSTRYDYNLFRLLFVEVNGVHSASWVQTEELLDRKVAAPV
jgi:hypothetical protein